MEQQLLSARKQKGWSQKQAAFKLKVSQPYLSLLERGTRRLTEKFAHRAQEVYGSSAVALPVKSAPSEVRAISETNFANALASFGYPGFSYLKAGRQKNAAEVLASALKKDNLDSRLTEALPWLVLKVQKDDWDWLVKSAKVNDLQNKLGFLVSLARKLAEKRGEKESALLLAQKEKLLENSRLAREDTLCQKSLTEAEKNWLRENRPKEAKKWGLLTDLSLEHLSYAQ
jgi:transcriptional regulator with XRE-family HTH domain